MKSSSLLDRTRPPPPFAADSLASASSVNGSLIRAINERHYTILIIIWTHVLESQFDDPHCNVIESALMIGSILVLLDRWFWRLRLKSELTTNKRINSPILITRRFAQRKACWTITFRKRRSDILQVKFAIEVKNIYELMDFLHGKRKGGEGGMSPKRIECH